MLATLLAKLSGHERVEAVHKTFANKTGGDALEFLLWAAAFVLAITVLLLLLNRFQQRSAQRPAPSRERVKPPPARPAASGATMVRPVRSSSRSRSLAGARRR